MSLNSKIEQILKAKAKLETKLIQEGLTKKEHSVLNEINSSMNEDIEYEGPERMEPGIERKITSKGTPFAGHPAIPEGDEDFIELISSERFKNSVAKVRRYLGDTNVIQGNNPMMGIMNMVQMSLMQIARIESQNKETLENLAIELVRSQMEIPEDKMQLKAELTHRPMSAAAGMRRQSENPSEEDIKETFKKAEEHTEELAEFADEFAQFDAEKSKRRFVNALNQGAAFEGGNMYVLLERELNDIDPNLMDLYGVTQSLMEHLYWLYPDMEQMAGSGQGQLAQNDVDDETDPPTVTGRGFTFPLLVHELIKGVKSTLGTHGLPDDPKQAKMVMGSEDTLPGEVWDSRLGPIFWNRFRDAYPDKIFTKGQRYLQNYLFARFVSLNAEEFNRVAQLVLSGKPEGKAFMSRLVDGIVADLKKQAYEEKMSQMSKEYDDDDDMPEGDLSSLGF